MIIREWRNNEWEHGDKGRDQYELQRMARNILENAEQITNDPTPGHSRENLSRVYTAQSKLVPNLTYIIHMDGFTVQDITEIYRSNEELERLKEIEGKEVSE